MIDRFEKENDVIYVSNNYNIHKIENPFSRLNYLYPE
jgi:hypothetical protein